MTKTTCFTCGNDVAKGEAYKLFYAEGFERTFCAKCCDEREHYQWDAEVVDDGKAARRSSVDVWSYYQHSNGEREAAALVLKAAADYIYERCDYADGSDRPDQEAVDLMDELRDSIENPPAVSA